jgi:hypothetical protein
MHNFTPEDLVQYLYSETSPEKTAAIQAAIETDFNLREQFETLVAGRQQLAEIKMSPSVKTMDKILQYAEKAVGKLSAEV